MSGLNTKYESALKSLPNPGGGGYHHALLGCANLGIMIGLEREALFRQIRANTPHGGRRVSDQEIKQAIATATRDCGQVQTCQRTKNAPKRPSSLKPVFNGTEYFNVLVQRSDGITDADIWESSPIRINWETGPQDTIELLRNLYSTDDFLFIGDRTDTDIATVQKWTDWIMAGHNAGPLIIMNPLTGEWGETKSGKASKRCDNTVAKYRWLLVEHDQAPKQQQLQLWHSIIADDLLPISALIDSGGKSIHAWVCVDALDLETYRAKGKELFEFTNAMNFDSGVYNPSRLARLPGCRRNSNWQKLLYLKPY